MKKNILNLTTAIALGCVVASPAMADGHKYEVTGAVGYNFFDNDTGIDDGEFLGLGFGYVVNPKWTLEAWITDGDSDLDGSNADVDIESYRLDALYHLPEFGAWKPYIVGGLGRAEFDTAGFDADSSQLNLGAGLKRHLAENWVLRGDVRAIDNIDQGSDLDDFGTDFAVQLALSYVFGGSGHQKKPEPVTVAKAADSDGDGVVDTADLCPNTPAGVSVNSRGCPLDSDGDGVYDYQDRCPGTAANLKVDSKGCPLKLTESVQIELQVNFDTNSSVVKPEYFAEIKRVADFMNQYANTAVEVQGHTDSRGGAAYNKALSQRRADAVAAVLVTEHGVDPRRVSGRGYGEEQPIASNDTAEGRANNRRVVGEISTQVESLQKR